MTGFGSGAARPSWSRRLAAMGALVALASVVIYIAVEALARWWVVLISVVALATAVIAAWYVLSRRGMRRAIAAAVAVVALAVFIIVVVASESLRVLIVGLVLGGLSSAAAGWALRPPSSPDDVSASVRPAKPRHPVRGEGGTLPARRRVPGARDRTCRSDPW